jgi:long-chain acyl-CoA synthetase
MMGYYKDVEKTKEVIKDGYFHTGDIGHIDEDGFLKITDRKKEMFKTSGGKYVAPQVIENVIKQSMFIEQVMVIGEGQKHPAALVEPNKDALNTWLQENEETELSLEEMSANKKVMDKIKSEVDIANEQFAQWEKVKKILLTPDAWSVESGHLTPTMKLRRKIISNKYTQLIERIYN